MAFVPYNSSNPTQQAFLHSIQQSEGTASYANPYAVGFGGVDVSGYPLNSSGFPNWSGNASYNTHAAGAYQFQPATWSDVSSKTGQTNFNDPDAQNANAWYLAQRSYTQQTGGDLSTDLQNSNTSQVAPALASQWQSLQLHPSTFNQNLANNLGNPQPLPSGSSSATAGPNATSTTQSGSTVSAVGASFTPAQQPPPLIYSPPPPPDWRVRLSPLYIGGDANFDPYGPPGGLCDPLRPTSGMVFPYTPSVQFTQDVDYREMQFIHANMDFYTYARTPTVTLAISGKFTCQNQAEAAYALAAVHFIRSSSKMYYGQAATNLNGTNAAGLPPPILVLDGYGQYMFNRLNVILRNYNITYDETMDTVPVILGGAQVARLPALFTLSVSVTVQQTPLYMRTQFDLQQFRSGALMTQGGWI